MPYLAVKAVAVFDAAIAFVLKIVEKAASVF
jgi:hypothetical protein